MRISPEVIAVLSRCTVEGNELFLPKEQLDRKLYVKVNEVLESLGGVWTRKRGAHVFIVPPADALDRVLTDGEVTTIRDMRKETQFFPTPAAHARRLVELAKIEPGTAVLEPSAGDGALAAAVLLAGHHVECLERDEQLAAKCAERLGQVSAGSRTYRVEEADFLAQIDLVSAHDNQPFQRIVMNPPFSRRQDVRHVEHAIKALAPGGRLVSVMGAGIRFRDDAETRALRNKLTSIVDDPPGTFRESGTDVNTCTVIYDKP